LECGDLSPLWSVATCRGRVSANTTADMGVKPPKTKAVTGHRTPKIAGLPPPLVFDFR
jgi:hypothetical protein